MTGILYIGPKHGYRRDRNVILLLFLVQHGSVLKDSCYILSCLMGIQNKVRVKHQCMSPSVACHTAIMTLSHVMGLR